MSQACNNIPLYTGLTSAETSPSVIAYFALDVPFTLLLFGSDFYKIGQWTVSYCYIMLYCYAYIGRTTTASLTRRVS